MSQAGTALPHACMEKLGRVEQKLNTTIQAAEGTRFQSSNQGRDVPEAESGKREGGGEKKPVGELMGNAAANPKTNLHALLSLLKTHV